MQAWHQKNLLEADFPFNLFITDIIEYPPHWHEEIEVIYVLDESLKIGLNNEIYTLRPRDIFLIGIGDVHYFLPQANKCKRIIIQFELAIFEQFTNIMRDMRFAQPLIAVREEQTGEEGTTHKAIENQILSLIKEYENKYEGYKMALKARLYDLGVILIRQIPMEKFSPQQKSKHINHLERLDQVFHYVETNYDKEIPLDEISNVANFSVYHFTRFFKETTGMTFVQYLNNFRVAKAVILLKNTMDPITEVVFKSGFNSVKTFNRVFKQIKGISPTQYRKSNI